MATGRAPTRPPPSSTIGAPRIRVVEHQRPATGAEGFSADEVATDLNFIVTRRRAPWPKAQARADAIVAAWDAWTAETARRREALGLPALFQAEADTGSAVCALLGEVRDHRPVSLADLIAKACVTVDEVGSADELVDAMAEADTWSEELALSLVRDLLTPRTGGVSMSIDRRPPPPGRRRFARLTRRCHLP